MCKNARNELHTIGQRVLCPLHRIVRTPDTKQKIAVNTEDKSVPSRSSYLVRLSLMEFCFTDFIIFSWSLPQGKVLTVFNLSIATFRRAVKEVKEEIDNQKQADKK